MTLPGTPSPSGSEYRGVPVMVLGASGFIGRWVARALCERGAVVHVVARDRARTARVFDALGVDANLRVADLADTSVVPSLLDEASPAVVFNLASYGVVATERDEDTCSAINTNLVVALTDAMQRRPTLAGWSGQRVIHVGSALEYGSAPGELDETTRPEPIDAYGRSKLAATEHLRRVASESGFRAVTARLFTVYGPGERAGRLLPALIDARRHATPLDLTAGDQLRDFTYVEDAAEGLVRLGISRAPAGAVVNVATGRLTSVRAFAETAADILGMPAGALRFGARAHLAREMFHGPVRIERLREFTAWTPPTDIAGGIARTWSIEQARQHSHV